MPRLTAKDLRALKGQRQLVKLSVTTPEQARAAEAAGIDILSTTWRPGQMGPLRAAAPGTMFVYALSHGGAAGAEAELARAFAAKAEGADACYCPMRPAVVEVLAAEGIAVVAHVGLVPSKATWAGGLRPVGKTADEALALWARVQDYEAAGALALELELVPEPVATEIARRTSLTVFSMGSGAGCDGQFLFACDVLGETEGRIPRHARAFRDFRSEYGRLQREREAAFAEYRAAVADGSFPGPGNVLPMAAAEWERFLSALP